jgi:hypothetical protein
MVESQHPNAVGLTSGVSCNVENQQHGKDHGHQGEVLINICISGKMKAGTASQLQALLK